MTKQTILIIVLLFSFQLFAKDVWKLRIGYVEADKPDNYEHVIYTLSPGEKNIKIGKTGWSCIISQLSSELEIIENSDSRRVSCSYNGTNVQITKTSFCRADKKINQLYNSPFILNLKGNDLPLVTVQLFCVIPKSFLSLNGYYLGDSFDKYHYDYMNNKILKRENKIYLENESHEYLKLSKTDDHNDEYTEFEITSKKDSDKVYFNLSSRRFSVIQIGNTRSDVIKKIGPPQEKTKEKYEYILTSNDSILLRRISTFKFDKYIGEIYFKKEKVVKIKGRILKANIKNSIEKKVKNKKKIFGIDIPKDSVIVSNLYDVPQTITLANSIKLNGITVLKGTKININKDGISFTNKKNFTYKNIVIPKEAGIGLLHKKNSVQVQFHKFEADKKGSLKIKEQLYYLFENGKMIHDINSMNELIKNGSSKEVEI